jgi:SAM-dependent methyltransferase
MSVSEKNIDKKLDDTFYQKTLRPDRQQSYKLIAKFITRIAWPHQAQSAVDYGCGAGWILRWLNHYGVTDLIGIEPNRAAASVMNPATKTWVEFRSLRRRINLDRKFDLAVCLEVGEHLEERYADLLVENITKSTDLLIFSAATPGQGGWGHVNEQPLEYWKEKLRLVGFLNLQSMTAKFRVYLENKGAKKWYCNNIAVFERGIVT